jgi:hypothetical protein
VTDGKEWIWNEILISGGFQCRSGVSALRFVFREFFVGNMPIVNRPVGLGRFGMSVHVTEDDHIAVTDLGGIYFPVVLERIALKSIESPQRSPSPAGWNDFSKKGISLEKPAFPNSR